MIISIIKTLIGLFCCTALWWAAILFEHRPAGWPNLALSIGPFHPVLHLPDGPYARLDALSAAEAAAQAQGKALAAKQAQIGATAAAHEQSAQTAIAVRYRTIIQKVPTYVTAQDDLRYPLSVGFVRVHDAAALGVDPAAIPLPAGQSDDARSTIAPSQLAGVIVGNYSACTANARELTDLQAWITAQEAANPPKP
jgi:hypothetical protein